MKDAGIRQSTDACIEQSVFKAYLNVNTAHKIQKNLSSLMKTWPTQIELFNQSILRLFNQVSVQSAVHLDTIRRYDHKKKSTAKKKPRSNQK